MHCVDGAKDTTNQAICRLGDFLRYERDNCQEIEPGRTHKAGLEWLVG